MKVKYSEKERALLALLPKGGGRITSTAIAEGYYSGRRPFPFHGRIIIIGTLRSLARKVAHNREPFRIAKGPRNGPHPIEFWIEQIRKRANGKEARV